MKKIRFVLVLSLFLISLGFSSCKKEDVLPDTTVICWTDSKTAGGAYIDIFIDGTLKGRLTEFRLSAPGCEATQSLGTVVFKMQAGVSFSYRGVGQDGKTWSGTSTATSSTTECRTLNFN